MLEQKCENQTINVVVPIVLSEEKRKKNEYSCTYKIESNDLIKYAIKFYYVSHKYENPLEIRITDHLPPELELIPHSVYCGECLLEGDLDKGIILPKDLLLCVREITFLCLVKGVSREYFENIVEVDYAYETEKGRTEQITVQSSGIGFQHIAPKLEMTLSQSASCTRPLDAVNYHIHIVNIGNTALNDACLIDHLPKGIEYVQGSLCINGEPAIFPEFHGTLELGTILPEETIEITIDTLIVEAEMDTKSPHYVEVTYFYQKDKKKKGVSQSNPIVLTKKKVEWEGNGEQECTPCQREVRSSQESDECDGCGSYSNDQQVCIKQQAKVGRMEKEEVIHYTVWIENHSKTCLIDAYMLYTLYYKLQLVPGTLRINDYVIKGTLQMLKLPLIEEKGKKQANLKVSFDAKVRKEFETQGKLCMQNHVRIKYKDECGRCLITKASCIKTVLGKQVKPLEMNKTIKLPKEYEEIERIEKCEVNIEHIQPCGGKKYEIQYSLITYYRGKNGRNDTYVEKGQIEMTTCCGSKIEDLQAFIKGKPILYNSRCFQVNIMFVEV